MFDNQKPVLLLLYLANLLLMSIPGLEFSGSVHRGVPIGNSDFLKKKRDNYRSEYAAGTKIYLPAPTSTSMDDAKASEIMGLNGGIIFTYLDVSGLLMSKDDLSMYDEAEVLLMGPMVFKVISSVLFGKIVHVTCVVEPTEIRYLVPHYHVILPFPNPVPLP